MQSSRRLRKPYVSSESGTYSPNVEPSLRSPAMDSRKASHEFEISDDTLPKRLVAAKIQLAPSDRIYSTAQLTEAIFGSIQSARLKESKREPISGLCVIKSFAASY